MSFIPSSTTINLEACITETGRRYLFGIDIETQNIIRFNSSGVDLFSPVNFSLNDSDINYRTVEKTGSGEVPNVKGNRSNSVLSTCVDSLKKNFLINSLGFSPNISFEDVKITSLKSTVTVAPFSVAKTKIKIDQSFEAQVQNPVVLLYIDTDNTTLQGYGIIVDDHINPPKLMSQIEYNNITYTGVLIQLTDSNSTADIEVLVAGSLVINKDDPKKIIFKLIPVSNCDLGFIPMTTIQVNGTTLPPRDLSFTSFITRVKDKAGETLVNYIGVSLSAPEYEKIKTADLQITLTDGLNPFRVKNLKIELLNPIKIGDSVNDAGILFSKNYIATLLETNQTVPITFDEGTQVLYFKITKPFLNIQTDQSVTFTITNTYRNTKMPTIPVAVYAIGI